MNRLKINIDCGEIEGDHLLVKYGDMINICCGAHAGNEATISAALAEGILYRKLLGDHPGYPDKKGWGRGAFRKSGFDCFDSLFEQISLVKEKIESEGGRIHHVKLHGQLYHDCFENEKLAHTVLDVVGQIDRGLKILMASNSYLYEAAKNKNFEVIAEGFADRRYNDNGRLVPRNEAGSFFSDANEIKRQIKTIENGYVLTNSGNRLNLECASVCIHGDGKFAEEVLKHMARQI